MSKLPAISAICLVYGRTSLLQESLACFLAQDYTESHEIVLLNSAPQQQLVFGHPRVKIVNLAIRPPSLSDCRNLAIENATWSHICTWDSDDQFAPNHLSMIGQNFRANDWIWLGSQFYMVGGKILKIVQGSMNTVAYTKDAWRRVGKFTTGLSVGEDRDFVGRLTTQTCGEKIAVKPEEISFLYGWGNGAEHLSGLGDDKPGRTVAYERARLDLERRVRSGTVKTGRIVLQPQIKVPPAARIATFLTSKQHLATVSPGEALRASTVKLIHAVERHEEPTNRRKEQAWESWKTIYAQGVTPSHYWKYARDATSIGDKRKLPFLKDVLAFALEKANNEDVVFLTNDDIVIHPQLPDRLLRHVQAHGPCSSQRCEFRGNIPKLTLPPEQIASLGRLHMGRDLFAGTKRWWLSVWEQLPDYILAASDWDLGMACLVRNHHGIASTRKNLEQNIHPAELQRGLLLHAFHVPLWADKKNVNSAASQVWNRQLFRSWSALHLPSLVFHGSVI